MAATSAVQAPVTPRRLAALQVKYGLEGGRSLANVGPGKMGTNQVGSPLKILGTMTWQN